MCRLVGILWGRGSQEAVALSGTGADDHGLLPEPRPPRTSHEAVTDSNRSTVTFSAQGAPNADFALAAD
jgi:hypothetical protein